MQNSDFNHDISLTELLRELENEGCRMKELLELPFECRFDVGDEKSDSERRRNQYPQVNQVHRSQSDNLRIDINGINLPTSSHPSDPIFIQQQTEQFWDQSPQLNHFSNENKQPNKEDVIPQNVNNQMNVHDQYRDGYPAVYSAVNQQRNLYGISPHFNEQYVQPYSKLSSRLTLANLSPVNLYPQIHSENSHRRKSKSSSRKSTNDDLEELCRKLRKTRQRNDEARRHAEELELDVKRHEKLMEGQTNRVISTYTVNSSQSNLNTLETTRIINPTTKKSNFHNHQRSESMPVGLNQNNVMSRQRLETAARMFPLIQKPLSYVLGMRGNSNLAFEFMELVERKVKICEDGLKRLMRERCNIPKMRRNSANYKICAQQKDLILLQQLSATIRQHLDIKSTDDYIARQQIAKNKAPERKKQLEILETTIGQVLL